MDWNADAEAYIESGQFKAYIPDGGDEMWHVQLSQLGLSIEQGKTYELTFDAKVVEAARNIYAIVEENGGDYTAYNSNYDVSLSTSMQTYTLTFTMTESTDNNAALCFGMGINYYDVIIDNVELREVSP